MSSEIIRRSLSLSMQHMMVDSYLAMLQFLEWLSSCNELLIELLSLGNFHITICVLQMLTAIVLFLAHRVDWYLLEFS